MPIPWLMALKAIPWATVLAQAPAIAKAAETLLSGTKARQPDAASASELQHLAARVAMLERRDLACAELLSQMTGQIAALTTVTEVLAARLRWLLVIGIAASAVALVALAVAIVGR